MFIHIVLYFYYIYVLRIIYAVVPTKLLTKCSIFNPRARVYSFFSFTYSILQQYMELYGTRFEFSPLVLLSSISDSFVLFVV